MEQEGIAPDPSASESPENQPITLTALCKIAARDMGRDKPLNISTVRSWATKGLLGVKLKTFMTVRARMTTLAYYKQFKEEYQKVYLSQQEEIQQRALNARNAIAPKNQDHQKTEDELKKLGAV